MGVKTNKQAMISLQRMAVEMLFRDKYAVDKRLLFF